MYENPNVAIQPIQEKDDKVEQAQIQVNAGQHLKPTIIVVLCKQPYLGPRQCNVGQLVGLRPIVLGREWPGKMNRFPRIPNVTE